MKNCGSSLSGSSGILTSPNYPGNYDNSRNCEWIITAPAGQNLFLILTAFTTEPNFDKLFIVRKGSCMSALTLQYTPLSGPGTFLPLSINVNQNSVAVYFVSDSSVTSPGFRLTWTTMEILFP